MYKFISAYSRKLSCRGINTKYLSISRYMTSSATYQIDDLKRFLNEVGTDPREARYWLKQFKTQNNLTPFAVVQLETEVFKCTNQMEKLSSCLSFLQRHHMWCVVVHGYTASYQSVSQPARYEILATLRDDTVALTTALEKCDAKVRPMFDGAGIIHASADNQEKLAGTSSDINCELITWCMETSHIPIIPSIGSTEFGQTILMDAWCVTERIAKELHPLKVMKINNNGGFVDNKGDVVANVNLPVDLEFCTDKPWHTTRNKREVEEIYVLLNELPAQTSVVLTSVDNMFQELFSHHGCGTFFKITEPIKEFVTLDGVDIGRLCDLISRSFGRQLNESYIDETKSKLLCIYLSDEYNAVAMVTDEQVGVPYLDKFAVSPKAQGEGTGEMLWEKVRADYSQLFWRSRIDNPINSWYFKMSDGSWTNGNWVTFWYGISDQRQASKLVDHSYSIKPSFHN